VTHPTAWNAEYQCGGDEKEAATAVAVERATLLEQSAEFRLDPVVVLNGVLRAPDGAPLTGEEVTVSSNLSTDGGLERRESGIYPRIFGRVRSTRKLRTDEAGRFTTTWQQAAELTVSAVPKKFAMTTRAVTVAPGMEPLELKVSAPRRIAGKVRDDDGKPVAGVKVVFIGWAEVSVEKQVAETNAQGEFAWDAAPNEQIGLTFNANGFARSTEWVEAGRKEPVAVELRRE
jgi:hypothetical protein